MLFSRQRCLGSRLNGRRSGKRLANGGWNLIIKRCLAYRKYVTARHFTERRPVLSLEPRLEFAVSRTTYVNPISPGGRLVPTTF